jgi:uncharacterized protein YndB with AHSA1/START domain
MAEEKKTYEMTLPSDTEIKVTKVFDGPKELVWKIYTDKEMVKQWWGWEGSNIVIEEQDLVVGGKWRYSEKGSGEQGAFYGEYVIIDEPNTLAYTFIWGGMPDKSLTETLTFEERDGKTYMTDISVFDSKESRDGMIETGMEEGMAVSFKKIDRLIAENK